MTFSFGKDLRKNSFPLLMVFVVLATTGCQKGIDGSLTEEPPATDGVWVLKTQKTTGLAAAPGYPAYVIKSSFYYDVAAKTITYRDTTDGTSIGESKYTYDNNGRLIHFKSNNHNDYGSAIDGVDIIYNSDGLPTKIGYGTHDGIFQWSKQGANFVGTYDDPSIGTIPYSEGRKEITLNSKKQLIRDIYLGDGGGDQVEEAPRDENGDAKLVKYYYRDAGVMYLTDSIIYEREKTVPPRLSQFYSLWGNGIEWYSNGYFINFIVAPIGDSEYHVYANSLTKKKTYYTADTDANGNPIMVPYYIDEFKTEYDANQNPVKHTIITDGLKIAEVTFTWQKIKWIK